MNEKSSKRFAAFTVAMLTWGAPRADAPPLSLDQLSRCATQVQTLREESARIETLSARHDQTRTAINQRSAALKAERESIDPDDLERGLSLRQRLAEHTAGTMAFNAEIEHIRRDIDAVNALRDEYDRNCAKRPYRRADLESLPEPARNAMRAGLAGVRVPYLDPATPPLPR